MKSNVVQLGPDDLLLIEVERDAGDTIGIGERVTKALRERGRNNLVIVCEPGAEVRLLDEAAMNKHGWMRIPKAAKR